MPRKKSIEAGYIRAARTALANNDLKKAEKLIKTSIQFYPRDPIAHAYHGEILLAKGFPVKAAAAYQLAVAACPEQGTFWHGLGLARFKGGLFRSAIDALTHAAELMPENPEIQNNLGNLQREVGNGNDAAECYRRAIKLKPDFGEAFSNLGVVLLELGNAVEAKKALESAAAINPQDPMILTNLGCCFAALGFVTEAVLRHHKALKIDPQNTAALNNLAIALKDQGKIWEAHKVYDTLLALVPENNSARSNQLLCLNYREAFDGLSIFHAHRAWEKNLDMSCTATYPTGHPNRPLRVGLVSPDFWTHSVSNFLIGPLRHHNSAQVHITCYSDTYLQDDTTKLVKKFSDAWRDIKTLDDKAVSKKIKSDKIDILIDLAGHTGNNRLTVFANRAAPLQINWLGYPATTGLTQMDYRLTDNVADPPGTTEQFHSEVLVHMEPCFLCYAPPKTLPAIENQSRSITFGSFNNYTKLTDDTICLWARLMNKIPESRLVLKSRQVIDREVSQNIIKLLEKNGVGQNRVDLVGRIGSRHDHLAFYNKIDIALDTFPYNGTTTTCEALLMGVPVVTRCGSLHAGRVGASLLSALKRYEWIARQEDQFVDIAIDLAAKRPAKKELRASFLLSSLCDSKRFAHSFEQTLRRLWFNHSVIETR